jgi:hypothetical protein
MPASPPTPPRPDQDQPSSPPDPRRFYVVWSPQGGPPVVQIATFQEARTAANRLSLKNPDRNFFVLASCWSRMARPFPEAGLVAPDITAVDPEQSEAG